jgi:hypothetical protein
MRRKQILISALSAFVLIAAWVKRCIILVNVVRKGMDPILHAGTSGARDKESEPTLPHDGTVSRRTPHSEPEEDDESDSESERTGSQLLVPSPRESGHHRRDHVPPQAHIRAARVRRS